MGIKNQTLNLGRLQVSAEVVNTYQGSIDQIVPIEKTFFSIELSLSGMVYLLAWSMPSA